jgi:hypothetical protein
MSKKKTVLVETSKQGKTWSIKVSSSDAGAHSALIHTIRNIAADFNLQLLNASDPFGEPKTRRKKKGNGKVPTGPIPTGSEALKP